MNLVQAGGAATIEARQPSKVLSVLVVVAALAFFLGFSGWQSGAFAARETAAAYCVVHTSDGTTERLSLDTDTEKTYRTDLGYNTVRISGGTVTVVDADCKNHNCMVQGSISGAGEQIVCLPHEFYIEIPASSGDGSGDTEFDTVTR